MFQKDMIILSQSLYSNIMLESENRRINAKSIMGIMAFNPTEGMSIDIVTEGDDEQEALAAIEKFLVCE